VADQELVVKQLNRRLAEIKEKLARLDKVEGLNAKLKKKNAALNNRVETLRDELSGTRTQTKVVLSGVKGIDELRSEIAGFSKEVNVLNKEVGAFSKEIGLREELFASKIDEVVSPVKKLTMALASFKLEMPTELKSFKLQVPTITPPDFSKFSEPLQKSIDRVVVEVKKIKVIFPKKAKEAIPVRLSDGTDFYKAEGGNGGFIQTGSGGGGPSFEKTNGEPTRALTDNDQHAQVDVLSMPPVTVDITETTGFNGGPVTIGTTAVEMTFTGTTQGIGIQADHDNTGTIWIGGATVDSSGNNAIRRLEAGEAFDLDINDASAALYAVGSAASQKVFKLALT